MIDIQDLLSRFENVSRQGREWVARCPVKQNHSRGDRSPSLRVGVGRCGRPMLYCFRGCNYRLIREAVGLPAAAFYPDPFSRRWQRMKVNRTLESSYEYRTLANELVCEIQKYRRDDGAKEFYPRRPVPDIRPVFASHQVKSDDWIASLSEGWHYAEVVPGKAWRVGHASGLMLDADGLMVDPREPADRPDEYKQFRHIARPFGDSQPGFLDTHSWAWFDKSPRYPYRLPDWHERTAKGHPLIVVEGEKEADFLHALGYCATTNIGGAGRWGEEESCWLEGRRVVIVCDSDDPGLTHGVTVQSWAIRAGAKSVRLIDGPMYMVGGRGKDLSDAASFAADPAAHVRAVLTGKGSTWRPEAFQGSELRKAGAT